MVDVPALFMVWKGVGNDPGIYWSHTETGTSWVPQKRVPNAGTSHTPSLIFFHSRLSAPVDALFMVWKGVRGDPGIYWSHTTRGDQPQDWAAPQRVPNVGTSEGPSLAVFNNRLFMVWKGVGNDPGIYWSHTTHGDQPQDWAAPRRVPNVGTSRVPSLAVFRDRLHMVWKGVGDDPGIYWSLTTSGLEPQDWALQQRVRDVGTSEGPSLAVFQDMLFMVWKGVGEDPGIYSGFNTGLDFRFASRISNVGTSNGPRLSSLSSFGPFLLHGRGPNGQKLWMAWKGVEDDPGIYWSSLASIFEDWAPQKRVEGAGTSGGAALAFFAPVASRTPSLNLNDGMEVTQAIQDMNHTVALIAEKKTVVRIYLGNAQIANLIQPVQGELAVRRLPNEPTALFPSEPDGGMTLGPANEISLLDKRQDARRSLNFVLPGYFTLEGGHFELRLASLCDRATGFPFNVDLEQLKISKTVSFEEGPPLRVRVLGMSYSFGTPPVIHTPSDNDFKLIGSWLRRAYPASKVIMTQAILTANATPPFTAPDICAQLASIRALDTITGGPVDKRTHYYGLVSDAGFFMRGQAASIAATPDPTDVAAGPTGNPAASTAPSINWDTDASYGDWYTGHELGHTFGRRHPGFCCTAPAVPCRAFNATAPGGDPSCQGRDDPSYPFPTGQLSAGGATDFVGFDVGEFSLNRPMAALPGANSHDVMTYCRNLWLSSYTYNGIRDRLVAENSAEAARLLPKGMAWEEMAGGRNLVSVVGTVNLTKRKGKLLYVNPLRQGDLSATDPNSGVVLRVKRDDEQLLHEYPVGVKPFSDQLPGEDRLALLDAVIAVYSDARVVELALDGETVETFRADDMPPGGEAVITQGVSEILWAQKVITSIPPDNQPQKALGKPDGTVYVVKPDLIGGEAKGATFGEFRGGFYPELTELLGTVAYGDHVTPEDLARADVVAFERNGTAPPPSGGWESCQFTFADGENQPVSVSLQETADPARDPHILANGSLRGSDYKRYFGVMSGDPIPDSEVVSFVLFTLPELNTASPDFTVAVKAKPAPATVRLLDDFTTGPANFCVAPAMMEMRFQRDSMLGGVRCTNLYNHISPPAKAVCLNVDSAKRLSLIQDPEQFTRLEVWYGVQEDGVHPLGLNLHEGNARGFRATISPVASSAAINVINFNAEIFTSAGWSILGHNVGAGQTDFPFDEFFGPGGQDFTNANCIVFIFQTSSSFRLESIEIVPGGLPNEPDIDAIGLLPRRSEGRFISVVATVNLTTRDGKINYVNPLPQGDLSYTDPESPVVFRVKGADGQLLNEYQVGVKPFVCQRPGEAQQALVDAVLAVHPNARVVELVVHGVTVDTFAASVTPPGARRVRRVEADPRLMAFAWDTDAESEGEHTYIVQISTDEGMTWQTLAVGLLTPEITIDRNQFDEVESVLVRVIATDGFRSSVITSEPLAIYDQYWGSESD